MDNQQISKLVDKFKGGDKDAFQKLYDETWRPIYFLILKRIGDDTEAQEILQDVYIKIFRNIEKLDDTIAFIAWANKIAFNLTMDYLRKKKRLSVETTMEDEEYEMADDDEDFIPEAALVKAEARKAIMEVINSLPDAQKTAVIMFYYENMPTDAISKATNSTDNAVRKRLFDARKAMRASLEKLREKGVIMYSMSGSIGMYNILHQDALQFATKEIGQQAWLSVAECVGIVPVAGFTLFDLFSKSKGGAKATQTAASSTTATTTTATAATATATVATATTFTAIAASVVAVIGAVGIATNIIPNPFNIGNAAQVAQVETPQATNLLDNITPLAPTPLISGERTQDTETPSGTLDGIDTTIPTQTTDQLPNGKPNINNTQQTQTTGQSEPATQVLQVLTPSETPAPPQEVYKCKLPMLYEVFELADLDALVARLAVSSGINFSPNDAIVTQIGTPFNGGKTGLYELHLISKPTAPIPFEIFATADVLDISPPVITVENGWLTLPIGKVHTQDELLSLANVSAKDDYDETTTLEIQGYKNFNFKTPGDYGLTLNAKDASGNQAQQKVIIATITP